MPPKNMLFYVSNRSVEVGEAAFASAFAKRAALPCERASGASEEDGQPPLLFANGLRALQASPLSKSNSDGAREIKLVGGFECERVPDERSRALRAAAALGTSSTVG